MEKLKDFWSNKSNAERRKIIVYAIAGVVCVSLLVIVVLLNSKPTNKEVTDFSNPDAKEVAKYNSRAEANNMGKKDSASLNVAMDDVFGTTAPVQVQEGNTTYYEPNYSSGSSNTAYSEPTYSNTSPKSSNYNSHSTYGDYSMWQADEPKNNSVGYSNNKNVPTTPTPTKKSTNSDYTEIENGYSQPNYSIPSTSSSKVDLAQSQQVSAQLISQGYFENGRTLSFAIKDEATIQGVKLPKNSILQGIGEFQGNRIMVKFNAVKVKNKLVAVNITLLDNNGVEGMGIIGAEKSSSAENSIVSEAVGRTGTIGGIIKDAITSKGGERKIALKPKQVYLIIN